MNKKIALFVFLLVNSQSILFSAGNSIEIKNVSEVLNSDTVPSLDFEELSDDDTALCDQVVPEKVAAWRMFLQQMGSSAYAQYLQGKEYLKEKLFVLLAWIKGKA